MNRLIVLLSLSILLSGCIMSPDAPQSAAYSVPPPGWTPQSLAGKAAVAADNLTQAQQAAQAAQSYADQVKAASMEATAQAQATTDALNLAIAQQAATATAQAQAINATATMRADNYIATQQSIDAKVSATQTAVAIDAAIEATKQVAHERQTAFDLSASQNKADQDRAALSADIMAWIFRMLFFGLAALIIFLGYRIAQTIYESAQSKLLTAKLVYDDYGRYIIDQDPITKQITMTPVKLLNAPASQQVVDQVNNDEDDEAEMIETIPYRSASQSFDISKGSREYQLAARACRANAAELLLSAIGYLDSIGRDGQAAVWLPGADKMGWAGSKHDWYKKPIARHFDSKAGKGSRLIGYTSLSHLYTCVKSGDAPIDVWGRDASGNPTPLLPN